MITFTDCPPTPHCTFDAIGTPRLALGVGAAAILSDGLASIPARLRPTPLNSPRNETSPSISRGVVHAVETNAHHRARMLVAITAVTGFIADAVAVRFHQFPARLKD